MFVDLQFYLSLVKRVVVMIQASYWSAKRHEVHGVVVDEVEGKVVRNLFGKWSEALYCGVAPSAKCIWRPGQ